MFPTHYFRFTGEKDEKSVCTVYWELIVIFVRLLAPLHSVQSKPRVLLLLIYLERVSLQYIQPLARKNEKTTKSAGDHLCFNIILNILAIEWFRKKKYVSYEMVKEMFMFKWFKDH